jgi:hypothetical protein
MCLEGPVATAALLAYAPCPVETLNSIAELVKVLVSKISALFDVIDISFFVSGGSCMLALIYMRYVHGGALPEVSGALSFAIAILGSYVMGLLCFAMGRWVRRILLGRPWAINFDTHVKEAVEAHGLTADAFIEGYFERKSASKSALYTRLWAELRHSPDLKASLDLLTAYWVRAAVYDGLITAMGVWAFAVVLALSHDRGFLSTPEVGYGILVFIALGVITCAREASRSDRYQVDEITATLAHAHNKREREAREREKEREREAREREREREMESLRREPAKPAPPSAPPPDKV